MGADPVTQHPQTASLPQSLLQDLVLLHLTCTKEVTVLPDHLEVQVAGAPPLKVLYDEVGLKAPQSQISGVGGGT